MAAAAAAASPPSGRSSLDGGPRYLSKGGDRRDWDDDDEDDSSGDSVVMSCVFAKNRLGVAVYDAERGVLSVAEAAENDRDLPVAPVLQLFKYQFRLTQIVAPARGDEQFIGLAHTQ